MPGGKGPNIRPKRPSQAAAAAGGAGAKVPFPSFLPMFEPVAAGESQKDAFVRTVSRRVHAMRVHLGPPPVALPGKRLTHPTVSARAKPGQPMLLGPIIRTACWHRTSPSHHHGCCLVPGVLAEALAGAQLWVLQPAPERGRWCVGVWRARRCTLTLTESGWLAHDHMPQNTAEFWLYKQSAPGG